MERGDVRGTCSYRQGDIRPPILPWNGHIFGDFLLKGSCCCMQAVRGGDDNEPHTPVDDPADHPNLPNPRSIQRRSCAGHEISAPVVSPQKRDVSQEPALFLFLSLPSQP